MEKTLNTERVEEMKGIERSDRMVLIAAGMFAAVGFAVLLIAGFLQLTAVNRLAAVAASLPGAMQAHGLGAGEGQLLPANMLEQSTTRFLSVIERLEQRVRELEASTKLPQSLPEKVEVNDGQKILFELPPKQIAPSLAAGSEAGGPIDLLMGKVQTLLKLDQAEAALTCLDEVLTLEPGNTDALVKRGSALERLQRFDEAIQCYDRAIAQDNSMTMAYLHKGGVFNRMERYSEALECYEQALKTRSKGHAANVIIDH
jgi:tetratricopeptide (TPR) repeat protein